MVKAAALAENRSIYGLPSTTQNQNQKDIAASSKDNQVSSTKTKY
jgi:hypothetical protein